MSGNWKDRLDARQPLRERDVSTALRELRAATGSESVPSDIAGLTARVEDLEEGLSIAMARIEELEADAAEAAPAPKRARAKASDD